MEIYKQNLMDRYENQLFSLWKNSLLLGKISGQMGKSEEIADRIDLWPPIIESGQASFLRLAILV
jgi:hypothetical protein